MNIEMKYQDEIQKIMPYSEVPKNEKISSIVLFKDYFARLLLWRATMGLPFDGTIKTKKGQNLFLSIDSELVEQLVPIDRFKVDLKETSFKDGYRDFTLLLIYLYINWEIFKETPTIKKYSNDLPHPYESVFLAIKRGAIILANAGQFTIGAAVSIIIKPKYHSYRLPSLDDKYLDFIDERCGYHHSNIPSQEELNLLWEEFNTGRRDLYKKHSTLL